jgi:hypothetical protein
MKHRPVALLDACVLVPMPLADTLLRLAEPPAVFDARWSEDILVEMSRTLVRRFAKTPENARYRPAPHQPNGQSSERPPCSGRGTHVQGRLIGHIQSSGFPRDGWRSRKGCRTVGFPEDPEETRPIGNRGPPSRTGRCHWLRRRRVAGAAGTIRPRVRRTLANRRLTQPTVKSAAAALVARW